MCGSKVCYCQSVSYFVTGTDELRTFHAMSTQCYKLWTGLERKGWYILHWWSTLLSVSVEFNPTNKLLLYCLICKTEMARERDYVCIHMHVKYTIGYSVKYPHIEKKKKRVCVKSKEKRQSKGKHFIIIAKVYGLVCGWWWWPVI